MDKTQVYPIRFVFTVTLLECRPVGFRDLSLEPKFARVDFSRPIGYFRHDAVKQYNRKEYFALRDELYSLYDKVVGALLYEGEYSESDGQRMSELLKLLTEPSLKPIYRIIDKSFFEKYIA